MDSTPNADTSNELHPWVKLTEASLEKAKPGMYGLISPPKNNRLNLCVGKDSIRRSMLIWDRFLKEVATCGFKVRMEQEYPGRTIVTVDGEALSIRLREKATRTEHVPTPEERARMERLNLSPGGPTWDYRPSGKLVLTIDYLNCHNETVNQLTWADTDKKRIEDRLGEINDMLVKVAEDLKGKHAWAEEQDRKLKEEWRQQRKAARRQAKEKKRRKKLERQASTWTRACSIRQFVQAVREEADRQGGIDPESRLNKWIQWTERHAATIDPVASVIANARPAEKGG